MKLKFTTLSFFFFSIITLSGNLAYGSSFETTSSRKVIIDEKKLVGIVDPRFLSFSFDTEIWLNESLSFFQNTGPGKMLDMENPRLRELTRKLSPAYLRVGGTAADKVDFHFNGEDDHLDNNVPIVHSEDWDDLMSFVNDLKLSLFFTLNAGPIVRDYGIFEKIEIPSATEMISWVQEVYTNWSDFKEKFKKGLDGDWKANQFIEIMNYANRRGDKGITWELGNEMNAFWVIFKNPFLQVRPSVYATDYARARETLHKYRPHEKIAGPASAIWPGFGETIPGITEITPGFLSTAHEKNIPVDIFTWHYYPTQTKKCGIQSRNATFENFKKVEVLDEFRIWATRIGQQLHDKRPNAELWLGESGPAQCGGEPNLSNTFISTLWWLDELGSAAITHHKIVVRQSLVGSHYGLLKQNTYEPNPDYFSSLLWKRLMGEKVLRVQLMKDNQAVGTFNHPGTLRLYAHCTSSKSDYFKPGAVTLLALNVSSESVDFEIPKWTTGKQDYLSWNITSESPQNLLSSHLKINGKVMSLTPSGSLPRMISSRHTSEEGKTLMEPFSAKFFVFSDADFKLCR